VSTRTCHRSTHSYLEYEGKSKSKGSLSVSKAVGGTGSSGSDASVGKPRECSSPQSVPCRQCANMDAPLSECTISVQRAVIRFLWAEGIKPSGIHRRMLVLYGDKCTGQRKVYE
jgi:hypothetical protein